MYGSSGSMHGASPPFVPGWPPLNSHELYQQSIQGIKPLTSVTPLAVPPLSLAGYPGRHVDKRYSPGLPNGFSLPGNVDPRASPLYKMSDFHNAAPSPIDQHAYLQNHRTSLPYTQAAEGLLGHRDKVFNTANDQKDPEKLHGQGYINGLKHSNQFHKDERLGLSSVAKVTDYKDSHTRQLPNLSYGSTETSFKEIRNDQFKVPRDLVYKSERSQSAVPLQSEEHSVVPNSGDVYKYKLANSQSTSDIRSSLPYHTTAEHSLSTSLPQHITTAANSALISPIQPRDKDFHHGLTNRETPTNPLISSTSPRDADFNHGYANIETHSNQLISSTQPKEMDLYFGHLNKETHVNPLTSPIHSMEKDFHHGHLNKESSGSTLISPQHQSSLSYSQKPNNTFNPKASKIAAEIFAEAQSSMGLPGLGHKLPPFSNISNTVDKMHHGYSPYDFDSSERSHLDQRLENKLGSLKSPPLFNHWSELNMVAPNVSLDKRTNAVLTNSQEKVKETHKKAKKQTKSMSKKEGLNSHAMSMKDLVEKRRAEKSKKTNYYEDPNINELVDAKVQAILAAFREKEHQKSEHNVKSVPDTTPPKAVSSHMSLSSKAITNKREHLSTVSETKYDGNKQCVVDTFNGVKPKSDHLIDQMLSDSKPVREDLYQQVIDMRLHKRETLEKSQQGVSHGYPNSQGADGYDRNVEHDLARKTPTQDSLSLHEQINEMRMHRKQLSSHIQSDFNQHKFGAYVENTNRHTSDSLDRQSLTPTQQNPLLHKADHHVSHTSQGHLTLHQQVDEMRNLKRERHASDESVKHRTLLDDSANSEGADKGLNLSMKKDPYEFDDFHDTKNNIGHGKSLSDIRKQNGFNLGYLHYKDTGQHTQTNPHEGMKEQSYGHYDKNHYTTNYHSDLNKQNYHSNLHTNTDVNDENKSHSTIYTQKSSQGHLFNKKSGSKPYGFKSSLTLLKKSHKYHGKLSLPGKKPVLNMKGRKPGRPPGRPPKIKPEVKDKFADDLMKNLGFPPLSKDDLKSYMSKKVKLLKNGHLSKDLSEHLHKTTIPQSVLRSDEKRNGITQGTKYNVGVHEINSKSELPVTGVVKLESVKILPRPKSVDSALSNCNLKPTRRPRSLSFDGTRKRNILNSGVKKENICDKINGALSDHQRSDVDFITRHVQNLKRMVTGQLEDYTHELETNTVRTVPQCGCLGIDKMFNEAVEGPYYTHLGSGRSVEAIRKLLEKRTGSIGKSIRIEKLRYTAKEGKSSQGCPIAKWIIRRSAIEEKYLALVRHRPGHFCETAWLIVGLVAWEGVPTTQADDLYSYLTETLPDNGFETERRCGTNDRKTCACQGIDLKRQGASFSFGCSWSMYFNGCKFARSQTARKFKLKDAAKELPLEDKLQKLATHLAPLYKQCAPQAHFNQCYYSEKAGDCRLGNEPKGPFSGVTACADFCAHAHKDIHNMNNGSTVVVTLTKHRGLSKPDDEQLHVLPLYVLEPTDEYGSYDGQYDKIQNGSLEVLHHYPLEARVRSQPLESCRKRRQNKQSPGKKRGRPFRQPSSPWSGSTSSNQSTPKKGKFSRDYSFLHSHDSSQSSGSQGGTPVKHHLPFRPGSLESTPVKQHTQVNLGAMGNNSGSHGNNYGTLGNNSVIPGKISGTLSSNPENLGNIQENSRVPELKPTHVNNETDLKQKDNISSHIKRFPPEFEGLYSRFWDYFEVHGSFPPPAFMAQYARACQMMNINQGGEKLQNNSQQLPPTYKEATNSQNRSQHTEEFDHAKDSKNNEQNTANYQRSVQHPYDQTASVNNLTSSSSHQGTTGLHTGMNYQGANNTSSDKLPSYQQALHAQHYKAAEDKTTGSNPFKNYQAAEDKPTGSNHFQNYQGANYLKEEVKQPVNIHGIGDHQTDSVQSQRILQRGEQLEISSHVQNVAGKIGIDGNYQAQTYDKFKDSPDEKTTPCTPASEPPHYQAADNIQTHSQHITERQQIPPYENHSSLQHQSHTNMVQNKHSLESISSISKSCEQSSSSIFSAENIREYQNSLTHQSESKTSSVYSHQQNVMAAPLDTQSSEKNGLSRPSVSVTDPFNDNMSTYKPDQHQGVKQSSSVQGEILSGITSSQQQQQHQSLSGFDETSHKGSKDIQQTTAIDLSSSTSNIQQNTSSGSHLHNLMYDHGHDMSHPSSDSQQGGAKMNQSPLSLLTDAVSARTNEVEKKEDPFTSIKSGINSDNYVNSGISYKTDIKSVSSSKLNSHQHEQYNGYTARANGMHKDRQYPLDLAARKVEGHLDPWRNEFHNFHANEQKSSKMSWNMFNYNSQNLPSQNNPSAMYNGQLHFNENKEETSIDPDVKCHMEYNEEAFRDPNIGGVAVALCHGAVLFEVAKRELHATTGLKNPNRFRPTRISLVFYQHKNLNNERHGMYAYAKKIENMKQERIERMREQRGFVDMEEIENSFKGGKKRKLEDLKQVDEEFDIMKTSLIHYRNMLECQAKREMSVTTSSFKTNWVKPEPMVTGPYQKWV